MTAWGQKQTSRGLPLYVRFWGLSGLSGLPLRMSAYSHKRTSQAITYRWVGLPLGHEALGFGDLVAGHILGNELLGITGIRMAM